MVQTGRGGSQGDEPVIKRAAYTKVASLTPESWGHNLVVRVLGIEELSGGRGADVLLGDDSGTIKFRAAPDQVGKFREKEVVVVRNASIRMLEPGGFMRLTVTGKWGKISAHPDGVKSTPPPPRTVDTTNNKSSVEYELVPVPEDVDDDEDRQQG